MPVLYTIGHSTHPFPEFIEILHAHEITHLVDVRAYPSSRRFPWFNKIALEKNLIKEKINYTHLPNLGGLRKGVENSINTGWRNKSFRAFADYMQTPDFYDALKELNSLLKKTKKCVIMCAEALPWRCHRSLIADAEIARNVEVFDIYSQTQVKPHEPTAFAVMDKNQRPIKVYYPKKGSSL